MSCHGLFVFRVPTFRGQRQSSLQRRSYGPPVCPPSVEYVPTHQNTVINHRQNRGTPDPWGDPKRRSTLGFHKLHHRSMQSWGDLLFGSSWVKEGKGKYQWPIGSSLESCNRPRFEVWAPDLGPGWGLKYACQGLVQYEDPSPDVAQLGYYEVAKAYLRPCT